MHVIGDKLYENSVQVESLSYYLYEQKNLLRAKPSAVHLRKLLLKRIKMIFLFWQM